MPHYSRIWNRIRKKACYTRRPSATPWWASTISGWVSTTLEWASTIPGWASSTPEWAFITPGWAFTSLGWSSTTQGEPVRLQPESQWFLSEPPWLHEKPLRLRGWSYTILGVILYDSSVSTQNSTVHEMTIYNPPVNFNDLGSQVWLLVVKSRS